MKKRIIVGISGASGVIYAVRLLEVLREHFADNIETHLIISESAKITLSLETNHTIEYLESLATVKHDINNIAASISSGSFRTEGMIITPCSIKTLSGIVNSYNDNLLIRAADVVLKERRKLILCVRETPLHLGHLKLMQTATENGAIIMPPVTAFYHNPQSLKEIIDQNIGRILEQFNLSITLYNNWK